MTTQTAQAATGTAQWHELAQQLRVAPDRIDRRLVDTAKVQSRAVAEDLDVEGWLSVAEGDGESEHPRIEVGGRGDVPDEQLWFGCDEHGRGDGGGRAGGARACRFQRQRTSL